MATGPSTPAAKSSLRARLIWPGPIKGSRPGLRNLIEATGWALEQAIRAVTSNPAQILRASASVPTAQLKAGEPANLVLFRRDGDAGFRLIDCCCDGVSAAGPV